MNKMEIITETIHKSINNGLRGTVYKDRILQQQSHLIKKAVKEKKIMQNNLINNLNKSQGKSIIF